MIHLFLAPGFEDIEAIAPIDILRRCRLDVQAVSITADLQVESAHATKIFADVLFSEADFTDSQALILPGGWPGAKNLSEHEGLRSLLLSHFERGGLTCALCAAPMVLGINGILEGRKATCYPGFEGQLRGADFTGAWVQEDGNVITGRGPGAALEFAYTIAARFTGWDFIRRLQEGMIYTPSATPKADVRGAQPATPAE
ncbi:MAG: DJ-1/PfpI family protein [Alloprevotella sp.]|nr:DJ-1/PfpI family protein [Alloprevotella sp.]